MLMEALACIVSAKNADKVHEILMQNELLDRDLKPFPEGNFIAFPLLEKPGKGINFGVKFKIEPRDFRQQSQQFRSLKEVLHGKLTTEEMRHLKTSFDMLGDIAIMEIPPELHKHEKLIAKALLQVNKSIKIVCKKTGAHEGIFRIEPVKRIAGEKCLTANYVESGCKFKIPIGKVFFSPRLSTERMRIAELIKDNEIVGAFFAGVGPFPIIFARHTGMKKAFAIELNPEAFKAMQLNIKLNNAGVKIEAIKGDVKEIVPKMLEGKCDRVVMPMPKGGETFLHDALLAIKPTGGTIHLYQFVPIDNPYTVAVEKIEEACAAAGKSCKIMLKKKVRGYAPDTEQIVIDFRVQS